MEKGLLITLLFLVVALSITEAKWGRRHHHRGNLKHKNYHCPNNSCYQPCELVTCPTNRTCVERIKTCRSNNSVSITRSHCEKPRRSSSCNCSADQICVRRGKASPTCRAKILNAQPVTNPVTCPKKSTRVGGGHRHRGGHKGRHGGGRHRVGGHRAKGRHRGGHGK